jgi:hypothetical protein
MEIALSDKVGEIDFYEQRNAKYNYLKYNLGGMSGVNPNFDKSSFIPKRVMTTTLDNFVKKHKVAQIDLMKIDTEGNEVKVLKGAEKTISKERPIIICETLFNKIEAELQEIMQGYGYLFYNYNNGKLIRTETLMREKDDGVRDCFFVPPEKNDMVKKYL